MKKKVLIIFKYPRANWNPPVIKKFSEFYETHHIYISDFKNKNFTEIIEEINKLIELKKIQIAVFDVDYFKFINLFFIEKINTKKKILITGDDFELHEINSITASACDIVLSHCPLSLLKYKEKGYEAHLIHFENDKETSNNNKNKEIDVLFFGVVTSDRKSILDYLIKEGINLKNVGHNEHADGLPENELLQIISNSKIVLNLSKSRTIGVRNYVTGNIFEFYYQFKGRIIVAGLNGAACVSEYSPGQELLFNQNEIPTFYTKEECVKILKELLADNELLNKYTAKFTKKVKELCSNNQSFEPIFNAIEKHENRKVKLIKIPYWYLRIATKQIILRNIKLLSLFKSISQLPIIINAIKKENFLVKLLIIIESILNILWYSLILTLKPKK